MNSLRPFTPTANRRLNELIGFLMFVFAILLVLALVSYSPLDPSLNTAANPAAGSPAHNWIGVVGALVADLVLQLFGVSAFLLPAFLAMYSLHWFRSRPISAPYAKTLGAAALSPFSPAFVGLLPWPVRWMGVLPSEGLLGRIVADALIHYFNVVGAYLICVAVIAVALVSLDRVLLRRNSHLVADAFRLCLRCAGSLCRLAHGARAQESCEGPGEKSAAPPRMPSRS